MKIVVFADLHGNITAAERAVRLSFDEKPTKLCFAATYSACGAVRRKLPKNCNKFAALPILCVETTTFPVTTATLRADWKSTPSCTTSDGRFFSHTATGTMEGVFRLC